MLAPQHATKRSDYVNVQRVSMRLANEQIEESGNGYPKRVGVEVCVNVLG